MYIYSHIHVYIFIHLYCIFIQSYSLSVSSFMQTLLLQVRYFCVVNQVLVPQKSAQTVAFTWTQFCELYRRRQASVAWSWSPGIGAAASRHKCTTGHSDGAVHSGGSSQVRCHVYYNPLTRLSVSVSKMQMYMSLLQYVAAVVCDCPTASSASISISTV